MPRKMTKFGFNEMFENMKLFLKRASSSDQIKSSVFFSLQFYIQFVEVLHYVVKNPTVSLYHSLKKLKMPSLFFTFGWLPFKNKRTKISAKLFPYSSIFHNCAQENLHNCAVYGKRRFHRYFLALNPLFPLG